MNKLSTFVMGLVVAIGSVACYAHGTDDHTAKTDNSSVVEMYNRLPEKYKIPGVKPAEKVIDFNINGWTAIDNRSLIIQASVSKRYLIILKQRSPDLRFAQLVAIDHRGDSYIRPGFDRVIIGGDQTRMPYYIQAIYVLDGREGAKQATEYIKNFDDSKK